MNDKGVEAMASKDRGAAWQFIKQATFTTKENAEPFVSLPLLNDYLVPCVCCESI